MGVDAFMVVVLLWLVSGWPGPAPHGPRSPFGARGGGVWTVDVPDYRRSPHPLTHRKTILLRHPVCFCSGRPVAAWKTGPF